MAEYDYEEGGFMALYFILTFLIIILIPLSTSTLVPSFKKDTSNVCECSECSVKQQKAKRTSPLQRLSPSGIFTLILWVIFFGIAYKLATTKLDSKIYDPFEILGLAPTSDEKAIKKHYKKLSIKFHPDKVKLAINQTIEEVSNHFVDLTKAYKALTDETVRENLRLYGNPDGKQDFKVGIALPPWVIESSNNGWVLGSYAILFGGLLPYLVGRWWFGSRQHTKDGVHARTAESFFKALGEDDTVQDVVRTLSQGFQYEEGVVVPGGSEAALQEEIKNKIGSPSRALILLYAHLLRIQVNDAQLRKEQEKMVARLPSMLASLLAMTLSHNWLVPSLHVMHLHAYLAQALMPGSSEQAQLPHTKESDTQEDIEKVLKETTPQASDITKAARHTTKLEVMDVYFKVLGERIITPGAIVHLVFQARVVPQTKPTGPHISEASSSAPKDERHQSFWSNKKDTEDITNPVVPLAHAPHWPTERKPQWWIFLADQKQNRVFVPPMKFSEVPLYDPNVPAASQATDRLYKLTFQAPPTAGTLALQVHFVSDSFLGEDIRRSIVLKVEDVSALTDEEQGAEDDISDPEEDSLAGQMAALRGGPVKRALVEESDDDDDSTTDGDASSDSDSDSDSD
ncbi:hypothetical protein DL93DRAFT_2065614 [Clavulina sp. PMI_390]|nr:hypothetical protein DL93DRAFT_2065614 [Clavulina sp. PMI_390]